MQAFDIGVNRGGSIAAQDHDLELVFVWNVSSYRALA